MFIMNSASVAKEHVIGPVTEGREIAISKPLGPQATLHGLPETNSLSDHNQLASPRA